MDLEVKYIIIFGVVYLDFEFFESSPRIYVCVCF